MLNFVSLLATISLLVSEARNLVDNPLGPYNVSDITVSGLSSGGFMTVQVHVAFSSIFKAAAVFAGGPYYCSQDHNNTDNCGFLSRMGPDTQASIDYTKQFDTEGKIDPIANIFDDQTYVWMGKYDTVVGVKTTMSLEDYYKAFVDNSRLQLLHDFPAQHTMPTLDWGVQCDKLRPPFIGKCDYDGAGEAFKHIWGEQALNPPLETGIETNLFEFDQTPYIPTDNPNHSLGPKGFIYVPSACQDGTTLCHLHFSFHGCTQTENRIGKTWADKTGYNRWAEANNIIVVYPNAENTPINLMGCWDYWGFSGPDYAWKSGVQMRFIRNLVTATSGI